MSGMGETKTNAGRFFEDFAVGQVIQHATPRTITEGDRALYGALYPTRFALPSSAEFAASVGLSGHPVEELIASFADLHSRVLERGLHAKVAERLDPSLGVEIDRVDQGAVDIKEDGF